MSASLAPALLAGTPCSPQCYGFVRFARVEDAEGVLEFAQQQGMWADERMLRINWAQGSMPDWKVRPCLRVPCAWAGCERVWSQGWQWAS